MEDFYAHQIFAKTFLHKTITNALQSLSLETPANYKPLFLQIANISPNSKTIILSDSINAFLFHISPSVFESFKNSINKHIMLTKLMGTYVLVSRWKILYSFVANTHKFEVELIIDELKYMDALNNEFIEGTLGKNSFYKKTEDFVIDLKKNGNLKVSDPLKQSLLLLKKNMMRKEYNSKKKDKTLEEWSLILVSNCEENKKDFCEEIPENNEEIVKNFGEIVKNQCEKIVKNQCEEIVEITDEIEKIKEKTKGKMKDLSGKSTIKRGVFLADNQIKLVYDRQKMVNIFGNEEEDDSFISELESLNISQETIEEICEKTGEITQEEEKNEKKRKIEEKREKNEISLKKMKIDKNDENEAKNKEKPNILPMNFSLSQILKYKSLLNIH